MNDLNKVLKFKNNNLGLDKHLGVSFGARGFKGAVAHFESWSNVINITRYEDGDGSKAYRFVTTGGVGSFAHEYGHFLDYFFGSRVEVDSVVYSLTGGHSLDPKRIQYSSKQPMRNAVEDIFQVAYLDKKQKGELSPFIKRVLNFSDREYYVRRCEVFARLFEQYIGYKLKEMGINNRFLTEEKYFTSVYMTNNELKEVVPLFDKLIGLMQKQFDAPAKKKSDSTNPQKKNPASRHDLKTAPEDYTKGDYTVKTKSAKVFGENVEKLADIKGNRAAVVTHVQKWQTTRVEKNSGSYVVTKTITDKATEKKNTTIHRHPATQFEYNYRHFV